MKKYYMSFVDFSEIINVTADEEQLTKACDRMAELELLTEKGNPSTAQIGIVAQAEAGPFYDKLKKRISRRPGGIAGGAAGDSAGLSQGPRHLPPAGRDPSAGHCPPSGHPPVTGAGAVRGAGAGGEDLPPAGKQKSHFLVHSLHDFHIIPG